MFDLEALEQAGFEKTMTTEEWEKLQTSNARRYGRMSEEKITPQLGSRVTNDYVLRRDVVLLTTEQNTQDQVGPGPRMTIQHPEIAILEHVEDRRRVTCDASNTELILLLADELAKPPTRRPE